MMDIIRESAQVPTNRENALERLSLLNHLQTIQRVPELRDFNAQRLGRSLRQGDYAEIGRVADAALAKLRATGTTYGPAPPRPGGDRRYTITWDELRRHAAAGHEIANHSVTHPFMPALDEANIVYEIEKANEDIREQLGPKHTFSIEAPYGIDDPRVRPIVMARFPLARNWVTDDFMDGILRGDRRDPTTSTKAYVQWQRGPVARSTLDEMQGWVDTSIGHGIWLVLVFHGIEGIGYEALTVDTMRAYLDYIQAHEPRLWIATFQDGGKYARERVNSKVEAKMNGEAIEVSVTHSLAAPVYDVPLTARTTIPGDWRVVRFRQGDDMRWLPVHREGGETFVQYRIAANGKTAVLEKGAN
jgi:hypothetical protein